MVETVASAYAIKSHHLYQLSPQQLISCDYNPAKSLDGCRGGSLKEAFETIRDVSCLFMCEIGVNCFTGKVCLTIVRDSSIILCYCLQIQTFLLELLFQEKRGSYSCSAEIVWILDVSSALLLNVRCCWPLRLRLSLYHQQC